MRSCRAAVLSSEVYQGDGSRTHYVPRVPAAAKTMSAAPPAPACSTPAVQNLPACAPGETLTGSKHILQGGNTTTTVSWRLWMGAPLSRTSRSR